MEDNIVRPIQKNPTTARKKEKREGGCAKSPALKAVARATSQEK
jgi:hypothetical protein